MLATGAVPANQLLDACEKRVAPCGAGPFFVYGQLEVVSPNCQRSMSVQVKKCELALFRLIPLAGGPIITRTTKSTLVVRKEASGSHNRKRTRAAMLRGRPVADRPSRAHLAHFLSYASGGPLIIRTRRPSEIERDC